jgi:hypothetical protein
MSAIDARRNETESSASAMLSATARRYAEDIFYRLDALPEYGIQFHKQVRGRRFSAVM